tara:strand:- start:2039 stop:2641 length:603 start_codon:yes stop_codon:yes gene_type:complete
MIRNKIKTQNIFFHDNKKYISIILILSSFLTHISCATEEVIIPIKKITDSNNIYEITDFEEIGFKKSTKYSVEKLPSATSAYYGFIKNSLGTPEDYEIRFYPAHKNAIEDGIKYAENITGENGCIKKECSLWTENLKHRQHLEGGLNNTWNGTPSPKYLTYVIHGNFILMCPGYDESDALENCTLIIEKINPEITKIKSN